MLRDNERLVRDFAEAVLAQAACILAGDSTAGNGHARSYAEAATEFLARGDGAIDEFMKLLFHTEPSVRVMAGAFLLKSRTEAVVAALKPIAAGVDLPALGARMTLLRYERGELELND